jgi:hypothetical protein
MTVQAGSSHGRDPLADNGGAVGPMNKPKVVAGTHVAGLDVPGQDCLSTREGEGVSGLETGRLVFGHRADHADLSAQAPRCAR